MIFTPDQTQELLSIVDKYHLVFIASTLGEDFLSKKDRDLLKQYGFNVDDLYSEQNDQILTAFKFGILSDALTYKEANAIDYNDLKDYIKRGRFIPLNAEDKARINSIKNQSLSDISKNKNRIFNDINGVIDKENENIRAKQEEIIRNEAIKTMEERRGVRSMVSNLGHQTGDWSRDFGRIAEYILHQAFDEGRAALYEREGGKDVLVYKDVYPGACKHCVNLYLTAGIGSEPIVFKLSVMRSNGTNIGRKPKDWKPVIGNTHPFCRCTLNEFQQGYIWDDKTRRFKFPENYESKVKRKKIKIEYNGKVVYA